LIEGGLRHHCNSCFTSYSVTVGTLFHQTHIDLQDWFKAIHLFLTSAEAVSTRKLAREIGVTKNTAASMIKRIRKAVTEETELEFLKEIIAFEQSDD
jgi:transposase-like protein